MQDFDQQKVRAHLRQQAGAGLPLLRGCPSTASIASIDWIDRLSSGDRLDFAEQLSEVSLAQASNLTMTNEAHDALFARFPLAGDFILAKRFGSSGTERRTVDVRRIPVKLLSSILKDERSGGFAGFANTVLLSDMPEARAPASAHAASFAEIVPVAPRRLRRLIGDILKQRFDATSERINAEHTRFSAQVPGGAVLIDVLFARGGGASHQFVYNFGAKMLDGRNVWMKSYEGIWKTASRWDYVTESNAERCVEHFADLIERCIELA
jgi:hypothetical protein